MLRLVGSSVPECAVDVELGSDIVTDVDGTVMVASGLPVDLVPVEDG